jgi:hypothetical protein
VLLITESVYAQFLIGAEAGGNLSWTSFGDKELKDAYNIDPVFGYSAGAHVAFRVRKRFFLHTSFLYSTKGKVEKSDLNNLYNKARYNYVEVPIAYTIDFKGKLGGNKEFKYFLGIGPTISYWLGGKGTIENADTQESGGGAQQYKIVFGKEGTDAAQNEMVVEDPNRIQLGLNFSSGIIFEPIRDQVFSLILRYELGHTFLGKEKPGIFGATYFPESMKIRNSGVRLSVAYLLDTKIDQRKKGKSTIKHK